MKHLCSICSQGGRKQDSQSARTTRGDQGKPPNGSKATGLHVLKTYLLWAGA